MKPLNPPTTRVRLPLLARILGWLLLNLLILSVISYFLLQGQFRFGLESLMAGPAGERVASASEAIAGALRNSPEASWEDILSGFSKAYGVEFGVYTPDGKRLAGKPAELPEEVQAKFRMRPAPPEGPGGFGLGLGPPIGRGPRFRPEAQMRGPPRFTVRTESPRRYWVGLRVPPAPQEEEFQRPAMPWIVLLNTRSLYTGGLFIDLRLWIIVGLGTLLISVLLWIPLVRDLTRAISQLTRATEEIAQGNFAVRVDANRPDELGKLGESVNGMAERLDGFVKGQKRFLGDIAHELCSPMARMQVGLGIVEETAAESQARALADVKEEMEEMSGLINELLSFSKASLAGNKNEALEPVRLWDIASEVVRREGLAEDQVRIEIASTDEALARPDLLRRALSNLLRNAVRYAGKAGPVTVSSATSGQIITLAVRDQGPGVPSDELRKIFDPFYRGEPSRSRETGGAGLGLAIVKSCVDACGGTVAARNLSPKGLEVEIALRKA